MVHEDLNEAIQSNLHRSYLRQVEHVVSRLRAVAEDIEHEGQRIARDRLPDGTEVPDYSRAARDVVHLLHWGIANAHVDNVVDAAYQADRAFRNPQ